MQSGEPQKEWVYSPMVRALTWDVGNSFSSPFSTIGWKGNWTSVFHILSEYPNHWDKGYKGVAAASAAPSLSTFHPILCGVRQLLSMPTRSGSTHELGAHFLLVSPGSPCGWGRRYEFGGFKWGSSAHAQRQKHRHPRNWIKYSHWVSLGICKVRWLLSRSFVEFNDAYKQDLDADVWGFCT